MLIGINASAAFKKERTGVEEYTYQLIKHLAMLKENRRHRFVLYTKKIQVFEPTLAKFGVYFKNLDFNLPKNFSIKSLSAPLLWTQGRLALEMFRRKPNVFFAPTDPLPLTAPENSVVVIHGLEYEYFPQGYPLAHRKYLRMINQHALKHARKIISVSENTKKDLVELYGGQPKKIEVIHHGIESLEFKVPVLSNNKLWSSSKQSLELLQSRQPKYRRFRYCLFLGRIELKKNIQGMIDAFEIIKEKYKMPHWLVLAGSPGFGYQEIKNKITNSKFKKQIIEVGYLNQKEKEEFLEQADVFLFPSFAEGFGLPILEAQKYGCPVVTSNLSSMPEVAGEGAVLVNPRKPKQIAEAVYLVNKMKKARQDLIEAGYENLKRFSWHKCARETLKVLTNL